MSAARKAPQLELSQAAATRGSALEMAPGALVGVQLSAATNRRVPRSTRNQSPCRISSAAARRRLAHKHHHRSTKSESNLGELAQPVACARPTSRRRWRRRDGNTRASSNSRFSGTAASISLSALMLATLFLAATAADDFTSLAARFALESTAAGAESTTPSTRSTGAQPPSSSTSGRSSGAGSPFIWQPLPLRATFRPLNRQATPVASEQPARSPRPPRPPSPPEPLALTISERSISGDPSSSENALSSPLASPSSSTRSSSRDTPLSASFFQPQPTPIESAFSSSSVATQPSPDTVTAAPSTVDEDDELPTRQPMTRFRPTRAPSDDADTNSSPPVSAPATLATAAGATSLPSGSVDSSSADLSASGNSSAGAGLGISRECFECICEASTNCNSQSRCQTSDVRHTRCGLFLISYDQWLATGLSRELVTREALQRDAAADERAFYECVTQRDCAQRLLAIYMERHRKDCDKDGRVDCYDMAAIHHSGMEQCASETLLDSQYWTDFNACLGFGR